MNSDDLRFFFAIANAETLAMAARILNVTPPNISQRLQMLEKKVGFKLIKRPSRKVSLTDEGWVIYEKAKKIIDDIDNLNYELNQKKGHVSGKLRVLAPLGFGAEYIAPIILEYKKSHPTLDIELSLSDIPSWASFAEWDIIIYIGELKDSSLHCIKLSKNQRYVCASPDYLDHFGHPLTPDDLNNHRCIALRENDEDVTLWRFIHNTKQVSIRITPWLSTNHGKTLKNWGLAGQGIIVRSGWDIKNEIDKGQLIPILNDYKLPQADIVALTSYNLASRTPRVQQFIELLKERVGEYQW